jgi:hypothetical protein
VFVDDSRQGYWHWRHTRRVPTVNKPVPNPNTRL